MVEGKLRLLSQCSSAFLSAINGAISKLTTTTFTVQQETDDNLGQGAINISPSSGDTAGALTIKPHGTSHSSALFLYEDTDEVNTSFMELIVNGSDAEINIGKFGAGTQRDLGLAVGTKFWLFDHLGVTTLPDGGTLKTGATTGTIIADTGEKLAFYGAAPVAKQTGVAVTAAGIHAALVNLGLIAA